MSFLLMGAGDAGLAGDAAATTAFLARVTAASLTIDSTHTTMYKNLINGLVSDGVWSKLDCLYFLATNTVTGTNTVLALMNLVSSSFTPTQAGLPPFVADHGYTGTDASSKSLNTFYNPATAGGTFTQNSSHISVWSNTNVTSTSSGGLAIGIGTPSGNNSGIFPRYGDGKCYGRINDNATSSLGIITADSIGFYVANRSGASQQNLYKNAVDQGIASVASSAVSNNANGFAILANQVSTGAVSTGFGGQISVASIGGSLTSTDVTNLYNRLVTARTAVGL